MNAAARRPGSPLVALSFAAALLVATTGCDRLAGPEERLETYMRAAYEGNGYAMQESMLTYDLYAEDPPEAEGAEELLVTLDQLSVSLREAQRRRLEETTDREEKARLQQELSEVEGMIGEFDAHVAKASLDLAERGELAGIDLDLVELNGDWACVEGHYRYEDGTTYAPEGYSQDAGSKSTKATAGTPDGYSFLHRRDGKWWVLQAVPQGLAQRFSITSAGTFVRLALHGNFEAASGFLSGISRDAGVTSKLFSDLAELREEKPYLMQGVSLAFQARRQTERATVVAFQVRVTDADSTVQTADVTVLLRNEGGLWKVDPDTIAAELAEIERLHERLVEIDGAAKERRAEEERRARSRPVVLLDQERAIRTGLSGVGLHESFTAPSDGTLRLDLRLADGPPLSVDLLPPGHLERLVTGGEYRHYPGFYGRGVVRQSFEQAATGGIEYHLSIRPEERLRASRVEIRWVFEPGP